MGRAKYKTQFCNSCNKETKMEILRAVEGSETKFWFKCSRCRHSMVIDTAKVNTEEKVELQREQCLTYSPFDTYEIGAMLYHTEWDDMGKIKSKEKTSGGGESITVIFEKIGTKKLIVNLQHEE